MILPETISALETEDRLGQILAYVRRTDTLEEQIAKTEEQLNELRKEHKLLTEDRIPSALTSARLTELKLDDGRKLTVKDLYYANISKDRQAHAFQFLRENDMGGVIKTKRVIASPLTHEQEQALKSAGIVWSVDESIHPSTLKAFVKERCEADPDFPRDLFGVHTINKATVK